MREVQDYLPAGSALQARRLSLFSFCVSRLRQLGKARAGAFGEGVSVKDLYPPSLARVA